MQAASDSLLENKIVKIGFVMERRWLTSCKWNQRCVAHFCPMVCVTAWHRGQFSAIHTSSSISATLTRRHGSRSSELVPHNPWMDKHVHVHSTMHTLIIGMCAQRYTHKQMTKICIRQANTLGKDSSDKVFMTSTASTPIAEQTNTSVLHLCWWI